MAKAVAGKTAKSSGAVAAADPPRLVGADDAAPIGEAEPAAGEDSNRELAFLKAGYERIDAALTTAGFPAGGDEDRAEFAASVLIDLGSKLGATRDRDARLAAALETAGLVPEPDQSVQDAAILLLARQSDEKATLIEARQKQDETIADLQGRIAQLKDVAAAPAPDPAAVAAAATEREAARREAQANARKAEQASNAAEAKAQSRAAEEAKAAFGVAVGGEVATFAALRAAAPDEPLFIRLAEDGSFIPSLAAIAAEPSEFKVNGGCGLYTKAIELSPEGPRARVTSAWLLAGGHAVRCEIAGGVATGGGSRGRIPPANLIF